MRIVLSLLLIVGLYSCNNSSDGKDADSDNALKPPTDSTILPAPIAKKVSEPLLDVEGIWFGEGDAPSGISIGKDSIYDPEHFESYSYKLQRDSIIINYPDFTFRGKVSRIGDTLIFYSEDGPSKFIKGKN